MINLFDKLGTKGIVIAAKEVATALHVLTSDAPFSSKELSGGGSFEALITKYFAGSYHSE